MALVKLLIAFATIFICVYNFWWKRRKFPPGPMPLPVFGNLLEMALEPPGTAALERWRKRYGPVFTYWLGEMPVVAFANYETISKTLILDGSNYTDREFFNEFLRQARGNNDGIFNMEGDLWRKHRKFILKSLKWSGVGSADFDEKLCQELQWLFNETDKELEQTEKMAPGLFNNVDVFVGSALNLWLFGYTFSGKRTAEFSKIKQYIVKFMTYIGEPLPNLVICNKWLLNSPIFGFVVRNVREQLLSMHIYFNKQLSEMKERREMELERSEENSFVNKFVEEMKLRNGEDGFDHETLIGMLRDFWTAGQDTITATIEWGLLFMIHNPDKQQKIFDEINQVVGQGRMITNADKHQLPYLSAAINEIQRLANLVPQNVPRRNIKKCQVNGHTIEPGTIIISLISLVLYDEKIFPEPHKFLPERFLNSDGETQKFDEFVPFSVGRRVCLGEVLARTEIFLFFANFLQRYEISCPPNKPLPSLKRNFGLSVKPERFQFTLKKRVQNFL